MLCENKKPSLLPNKQVVFEVSIKSVLNKIQGKKCKNRFVSDKINQFPGNDSQLFYDFV